MKKILLSTLFVAFAASVFSQWNAVNIGNCPTAESYDIALADGRNDGTNRVYVTTRNGGIYEWTYSGSSWSYTTVAAGPYLNLLPIAAGDARGDGKNRIYFAEWKDNGKIREATYSGGSWSITDVASLGKGCTGLAIGDGRGDGVNRLYANGYFGAREYSWGGSSWSKTSDLATVEGEGTPDIGNARNDGGSRLYLPTQCVREYYWNSSSFDTTNFCTIYNWPDALQIGDCRGDGKERLYANTHKYGRLEYTYNGNTWDITPIDTAGGGVRGDIHLAKLRSDGIERVYTTQSKYYAGPADALMEFEWGGSAYSKKGNVLSSTSGATAMLASGNGRNDDTIRLYAPNFATGGVYEVTHSDPHVIASVKKQELSPISLNIYPSVASSNETVMIKASGLTRGTVRLLMKDVNGKIIFQEQQPHNGIKIAKSLDLTDYSKGIYFIQIENNNHLSTQKLVVL